QPARPRLGHVRAEPLDHAVGTGLGAGLGAGLGRALGLVAGRRARPPRRQRPGRRERGAPGHLEQRSPRPPRGDNVIVIPAPAPYWRLLRITPPPFIPNATRSISVTSASGSPATAIRSANRPGSIVPTRVDQS